MMNQSIINSAALTMCNQLGTLMSDAIRASGLTIEQCLQAMGVNYKKKRNQSNFIVNISRSVGIRLASLASVLQGTVTLKIVPYEQNETLPHIEPVRNFSDQIKEIISSRGISQMEVSRRMDMSWSSFASFFTPITVNSKVRPKAAWLLSNFFAGTSHRLVLIFTPDDRPFLKPPRKVKKALATNSGGLRDSLTNGLLRAFELTEHQECGSDAASSWRMILAANTATTGNKSSLSDIANRLVQEAQQLHDQRDFANACVLSSLACKLLSNPDKKLDQQE